MSRRDKKPKRVKKNNPKEKKFNSSSLLDRFKAFLTDTFLISTPIFYIVIYIILGSGEEFEQNRILGWSIILGSILFIIVFFWYVKLQTPGMKAYDLKIVSTNSKERVSFIQALLRYIITLLTISSFFLLFIPYFRKDRRTIQDIFSNTLIVNEK